MLVILLASYLFMSVLGGLAVFLFGIAFPVLSKFFLCPLKEGAAGPGKNHSEKLNNKISWSVDQLFLTFLGFGTN